MRAFLTVVPDMQTALAINRWCELCWQSRGRKIPVQNYHMTLAFLGDVDEKALQRLSEIFEGFSHSAFDVRLNAVGYWSDSDVLFVGSDVGNRALQELHDKCLHAANRIGARGSSKRYEPHITLARKLLMPPPPALIEPDFSFQATTLELWGSMREAKGARYNTVATWQLDDVK